jgi:hypothetical protein
MLSVQQFRESKQNLLRGTYGNDAGQERWAIPRLLMKRNIAYISNLTLLRDGMQRKLAFFPSGEAQTRPGSIN